MASAFPSREALTHSHPSREPKIEDSGISLVRMFGAFCFLFFLSFFSFFLSFFFSPPLRRCFHCTLSKMFSAVKKIAAQLLLSRVGKSYWETTPCGQMTWFSDTSAQTSWIKDQLQPWCCWGTQLHLAILIDRGVGSIVKVAYTLRP